jgi:uncharacterized protein (DUF1778 family)
VHARRRSPPTPHAENDEEIGDDVDEDTDDLIREAAKLVVTHQQGSTSLLSAASRWATRAPAG